MHNMSPGTELGDLGNDMMLRNTEINEDYIDKYKAQRNPQKASVKKVISKTPERSFEEEKVREIGHQDQNVSKDFFDKFVLGKGQVS